MWLALYTQDSLSTAGLGLLTHETQRKSEHCGTKESHPQEPQTLSPDGREKVAHQRGLKVLGTRGEYFSARVSTNAGWWDSGDFTQVSGNDPWWWDIVHRRISTLPVKTIIPPDPKSRWDCSLDKQDH